MINLAYIRLVWRNNRSFTLFSMVFITLFQFMMLYLVTTFNMESILSAVVAQLPPAMKVFLNDSFFSMLTYEGAAAFGLNHPIVLTLLVILAVNIPAHHITREREEGTIELLLAHPFRRSHLFLSLWLSGCLILLLVILAALAGSYVSIVIFHHLTAPVTIKLLQIGLSLWLLISLIFTYTLMIGVFARKGIRAGNLSAVITLVLYVLFFITQIWEAIRFIKPINIFTYYEPQALMVGQGHFLTDVAVLGGLILICFRIGFRQFERRDVP